MPNIMYELKPGRIADIGVMRWWWWWPMFSLETPWWETSAYVCSLNWLTGPKTYNRLPFLSFLFYPHSDRANQLLFIEALSKMVRKTEDLFQTRKDHPSGTILEHVWGIIWGMSGTTFGPYCQQWTTIRGATCICDAVFRRSRCVGIYIETTSRLALLPLINGAC